MTQIIMGPQPTRTLDGSVKKAAYQFLEKLGQDDSLPGLHIEPIHGCNDDRVRTGRVNDFYRAVLVKLQGQAAQAHYIYLGTFAHDDAIAFAKTARVRINPQNGIAELIAADQETSPAVSTPPPGPAEAHQEAPRPTPLELAGITTEILENDLGMASSFARLAVQARTDDELLDVAGRAPADWQGLAVLDLAAAVSVEDLKASLAIVAPVETPTRAERTSDDALLAALNHPASRLDFQFVEDDKDLRRAIEDPDFNRWRVFLHPEQRVYATKDRNGAFRLSGGAGTGKTVVLLHRARHLVRTDPDARVVLTTFNKTLATSLREQLLVLDPKIRLAESLGEPGVYVAGIDAIARRVLADAGSAVGTGPAHSGAVATVLGERTPEVLGSTAWNAWTSAIDDAGTDLPPELRSPAFLEAEYSLVVLPHLITSLTEYLRVKRPGRGVALNRAKRKAVWEVIAAYRASAAAAGTTDFDEKARVAAVHLNAVASTRGRLADHVLTDEAQDLAPSRLLLLRALVEEGKNDLFLAEDSHQRIYGHPITLSHYGIHVRGRSRRLRLNYRTTAQNLHYAVGVLAGASFLDLEEDPVESKGYRSARKGRAPLPLSYDTLDKEFEAAAKVVRAWLDDPDTTPETIGLLVHTKNLGEVLARALSERGVETRFVDADRSPMPGKVAVMTMHRSKGMEFRHVVLFGVDAGEIPSHYRIDKLPQPDRAEALLRERSLLYVATTRARDDLVVMWSGRPSDLLPQQVATSSTDM